MALHAMQHVNAVRGSTNPQIILCNDHKPYVVKLRSIVRSARQLVSEFLVAELARLAGLPVPECAIVDVSRFLLHNTPLFADGTPYAKSLKRGLHFGSRCIGVLDSPPSTDILGKSQLERVTNLPSFGGMLALYGLCSSIGAPKAVFSRSPGTAEYSASFIGHDGCFGGNAWKLLEPNPHRLYRKNAVYGGITGWSSFEPFLSRLTDVRPEAVWEIARRIPEEWYESNANERDQLIQALFARRLRMHKFLLDIVSAHPETFPHWTSRSCLPTIGGTAHRIVGLTEFVN